jgi:hypothetical protein
VHYLVDGYNAAHWLAGDADLGPGQLRALLTARLQARQPPDAEAITIFWDSRARQGVMPQNEYSGWCEQRFVPIADDAIIDFVADDDRPGRLQVVSRDREVTGKSRQLGAKIMTPDQLLGRK